MAAAEVMQQVAHLNVAAGAGRTDFTEEQGMVPALPTKIAALGKLSVHVTQFGELIEIGKRIPRRNPQLADARERKPVQRARVRDRAQKLLRISGGQLQQAKIALARGKHHQAFSLMDKSKKLPVSGTSRM
jgi:ABC-type arginine transport system ATPase subunit